MSKHSPAPGFVLQRLDDKGRARWELNRATEEEKKKKKKEHWREEWSMTDLGSEWELGKGRVGRKKAAPTIVEGEVSLEEE